MWMFAPFLILAWLVYWVIMWPVHLIVWLLDR